MPYPADDEDLPLRARNGDLDRQPRPHPKRGFVKLEDTVAVTETGWEGFGDNCRSWNVAQV